MPQDVPHQWIDSPERLDDFLADVDGPLRLALDTEFMRLNTFYPQLALVQVGIGDAIGLVDPLAFTPGERLTGLLADARNVCIMHSASEDMEALADLLPAGPGNLFDTQIAAALAGMGPGMSYQRLVQALTGEELEKGETRSDWTRRPLTDSQREYAALDVSHLETLHAQLQAKLVAMGRLDWLHEECAKLTRRAERDALDHQPQVGLHGAAEWSHERQALLRRLLLWREHSARELDKPRPWLFNDKLALDLVARPPQDLGAMRERMRGQRAMRGAQCRALLEEISRPLNARELETTRPVEPSPSGPQRGILKEMKQAVAALAEELQLPPGLLAPRRLLEKLLVTDDWPDELEGWRKPLLEPRLSPLLP